MSGQIPLHQGCPVNTGFTVLRRNRLTQFADMMRLVKCEEHNSVLSAFVMRSSASFVWFVFIYFAACRRSSQQ